MRGAWLYRLEPQIIFGSYQLIEIARIAMTLSARFRWFLVDEFQDTTELQIEILKLLHATGRSLFFAVGDLAQSIYSFTGARPELVAPFSAHIGARQDLSLFANFRSSRKSSRMQSGYFLARPLCMLPVVTAIIR